MAAKTSLDILRGARRYLRRTYAYREFVRVSLTTRLPVDKVRWRDPSAHQAYILCLKLMKRGKADE